MGFTDFSEIRANWGNLSTADKDEFLGDMALMMLGEKIAVVPAVNMPPSNWQYAKEIISLTPAKTLLWVTPAAQVLFLAAIGFALYRGAYASAVVLLVAGYFITLNP